MPGLVKAASIIALAIIVASFVVGGQFVVTAIPGHAVYVVDKFTGSTRICAPDQCWPLPEKVTTASSTAAPQAANDLFKDLIPKP